MQQAKPLTRPGSMVLDVIRFGAAIAVAVGHLSNPGFSSGWPYSKLLNVATLAVAVFFVLSGFVIRLITAVRPTTARNYALDRISRLYSIVLPALVFSVLAALCLHFFPTATVPAFPFSRADVVPFFANLTFTGQIWGHDLLIRDNAVFWSLCYEAPFYVFWGLGFIPLRSWRWAAYIGFALIVGPQILFMLPLWLLGCLVHDIYQRLRTQNNAFRNLSAALAVTSVLIVLLWQISQRYRHYLHGIAVKTGLVKIQQQWEIAHSHHILVNASTHYYLIGVPTGILMLWLLLLVDRWHQSFSPSVSMAVRTVADGTFTLYLFHLPLFLLIVAYIPYDHGSTPQKILLLTVATALCVAVAVPLDALKRWMRAKLSIPGEASTQVIQRS
ncbi:acyltransferase [Granulicella sp. S156]|uniref:acyltransferase family protein n=1 Tax=Granulicella sp. S156 TaxID=1747224 RepID=UPI00131C2F88|nr:acyltransferase [Granulicella sp. S156]